jgi:dihydrolipoamide dehydrogenase
MKQHDVLVIGNGSGGIVVENALSHGLSVALVDKPPMGGTCQNFGCIPSKMLIHPADRIMEIQDARRLGVDAEIKHIDFNTIMERMKAHREEGQKRQREGIKQVDKLDFYEGEARFVDEYVLEVNGEKIKGEKIFIATGARPLIPPIEGIDQVDYMTNETVFELEKRPESMIIVGGGYIAVEFAHFFAGMGTRITLLEMLPRLITNEEPEISDLLQKEMSERMDIHTDTEVVQLKSDANGGLTAMAKNKESSRQEEFKADTILMATGRRSNADLLDLKQTGVKTDEKGYIKVDEYLQTSKENIWALGDITGRHMFKHVANREATYAWHNAMHEKALKMDYRAVPHAIFSWPQIASVGSTEKQAKRIHDVLVGTAKYSQIAMGLAMREGKGFAKAILDQNDMTLLGYHIIGPQASILIQEAVCVMAQKGEAGALVGAMHIHPALSEMAPAPLRNLKETS